MNDMAPKPGAAAEPDKKPAPQARPAEAQRTPLHVVARSPEARKLRRANILSCGIGLPIEPVSGDMNGLRLGTPEIVRWGMTEADMPELAALIVRGLRGEVPEGVAADVTAFRRRFGRLHFVN